MTRPATLWLFLLVTSFAVGGWAGPVRSQCTGSNLIDALSADDRAALERRAASVPFPSGNFWRATKQGSAITVVGTMHIYDLRMEEMMQIIGPVVDQADLVFVEAGRKEEADLKAAVAAHPELLVRLSGPTLPELLTKPEWRTLSAEMTARGIPVVMAAKFQLWYVSMLLGIPACAMPDMQAGVSGLDQLVIARAEAGQIPVRALESFDTIFKVFSTLSDAEQIEMIRAGLAVIQSADDEFATLLASYFAGQHRLLWEFTRMQATRTPGQDPARLAAEFDLMEKTLLTGRTVPWMDVLLPAAAGKQVVVAVGAAHLSGDLGLLNLLAGEGWTLTPLGP